MKKTLAIQVQTDEKTVKRALAVMGLDIPADTEINETYFSNTPLKIDLDAELKEESFALTLFFIACIYANKKPETDAD